MNGNPFLTSGSEMKAPRNKEYLQTKEKNELMKWKKIYVGNTESRGKFIAENIHIKINEGKCGTEFL